MTAAVASTTAAATLLLTGGRGGDDAATTTTTTTTTTTHSRSCIADNDRVQPLSHECRRDEEIKHYPTTTTNTTTSNILVTNFIQPSSSVLSVPARPVVQILQTYQKRWSRGAAVTSCEAQQDTNSATASSIATFATAAGDTVSTNNITKIHIHDNLQQEVPNHTNISVGDATITTDKHQIDQEEKEEVLYIGLFPLRQLWTPKLPYPQWDKDWDDKHPKLTHGIDGEKEHSHSHERFIRKHGITRHIILIRHGQYEEQHPEDEKRILTPLGRKQAELTGKRLAEMIRGINEQFGPCHVKILRVSDMARAKETAEIIAGELPDWVERAEPDPLLNEGRPCHTIPGGRVNQKVIEKTEQGHQRIEQAFRKYFYRSDVPIMHDEVEKEDVTHVNGEENYSDTGSPEKELEFHPQHEFEIIVCHANVIRYFLCRALQLPPEAWLRMCTFNCSLNYITIRPTGSVSVRMLGDIGHLGYEYSTFSMHHGFNW
eukprot:CAMPEP_0176480330 /NCGR_PEP_ID=MMETSP0200_2-20121128/2220_1 /TAXON_ID=947934 /ORGANISM="Chaetoceros sp., Strain GSL56" /LENGTH=486 /DNA_ID=CAMNT_0017876443 /DNA_START=2764 /DNA_END=4224 /DNA_ORIENTATION=+